jgi:hypothetical protein
VFQPDGFKETYAEMEKTVKHGISHRGRSLGLLLDHFVANKVHVEVAIASHWPVGGGGGDRAVPPSPLHVKRVRRESLAEGEGASRAPPSPH